MAEPLASDPLLTGGAGPEVGPAAELSGAAADDAGADLLEVADAAAGALPGSEPDDAGAEITVLVTASLPLLVGEVTRISA